MACSVDDALLSATGMFHRAVLQAGRSAELVVFDALPHSHWYLLHLPETREAFDIMVRFFNNNLA